MRRTILLVALTVAQLAAAATRKGIKNGRKGSIESTLRGGHDANMMSAIMEKARPLHELEKEIIEAGGKPFRDDEKGNFEKDVPDFMRLKIKKRHRNRARRLDGAEYDDYENDDEYDDENDDENDDEEGDDDAEKEYQYYLDDTYDFSGYAFKYAKCQPIQRYSRLAAKNGMYSALVTDDIIVFRLCPERRCSSESTYGCSSGYGEYAIEIREYLRVMMYYKVDQRTNSCNFCDQCSSYYRRLEENADADDGAAAAYDDGAEAAYDEANAAYDDGAAAADDGDDFYAYAGDDGDDGSVYDDGAAVAYYDDATDDPMYSYCSNYADFCSNTVCNQNDDAYDDDSLDYLDYLDYFDCVKVDDESWYYVKPHCDGSSGKISMGIFYDQYCSSYAGNEVNLKDIDVPFSNDMLNSLHSTECVSCDAASTPPYYNANNNMCNKIFDVSGKCNTYLAYSLGNDDYQDYTDNDEEDLTCAFTESIRDSTYDYNGEITTDESEMAPGKITTEQIGVIYAAAFVCLSLAFYACYLHHEITNFLLKKLSYQGCLLPEQSSEKKAEVKKTRSRSRRSRSRDRKRTGKEYSDVSDYHVYT